MYIYTLLFLPCLVSSLPFGLTMVRIDLKKKESTQLLPSSLPPSPLPQSYYSLPFPILTLVQAMLAILLRVVRGNFTRP